jgi:hypothetical protein
MKTASAETRALVVKAYTSGIATRKQSGTPGKAGGLKAENRSKRLNMGAA